MLTIVQATHDGRAYGQCTTVVTTFGGIEYYIDQAPAQVITFQSPRSDGHFSSLKGDLLPCTVIKWSEDQLDKEDLDATSAKFALHDDVWQPAFLEGETSCRHGIAIENC